MNFAAWMIFVPLWLTFSYTIGAFSIWGALFIIGWNIVWTSLIMIFIKYVCRVPLRMTDEMCGIGDYAIHGEEPYTFEYYKRNYRRIAGYEHPGKITGEERAIRQLRQSKELGRNPDSSEGQGSEWDGEA